MKVVLASGVFDLLHPGHLYYLSEAKKLGDKLVVVVTSDKTASAQGKSPFFRQKERLELIKSLKVVDQAALGERGKGLRSVVKIKPDVIALGYDQWQDDQKLRSELNKLGFSGKIVRIKKYGDYSSRKLKIH